MKLFTKKQLGEMFICVEDKSPCCPNCRNCLVQVESSFWTCMNDDCLNNQFYRLDDNNESIVIFNSFQGYIKRGNTQRQGAAE